MDSANDDIPVFDRRDELTALADDADALDWTPWRSVRMNIRGIHVSMPGDPPSDVDWFIDRGRAWYSSNFYRSQLANDNKDWPLEKLLNTEKNEHCLRLARRYRTVYDAASMPTQLMGRETDNLYVVHREDENGQDKGVKAVSGKKANLDTAPTRVAMAGINGKPRALPITKKWTGDNVIICAIDAKRELAFLRARLAYVPKILDAFEWAVCDGLTLEAIGKRLGAGSKGAKGEARARIFDGFGIVDRYWQGQRQMAA